MDLSALSDEYLTSILLAHDIQDIEHLSRTEKEALISSLAHDSSEYQANIHAMDGGHTENPTPMVNETPLQESTIDLTSDSEMVVVEGNEYIEASHSVETTETELTEEQNLQISQFCELTGSDPTYAKTILQATSWNVETAVSLYLEGIASGLSRSNSYQAQPPQPPMPNVGGGISEFSLPHPFSGADDWRRIMNMRRFIASDHAAMDEADEEDSPINKLEYDEDGVRRPDPVKTQRLISRGFSAEGLRSLGRAEDPSIDWLFPPPRHLSSQESFEQIRNEGKEQRRWILVNIQSHEEFPSHLLNRDTWTSESVESILRTNFLFWQRGTTTQDGKDFMRLYHIQPDQLPNIAIIDPRTGANVWNWTGFIDPSELAVKLTDFSDKNSLVSPSVPPTTNMNSSSKNQAVEDSKTSSSSDSPQLTNTKPEELSTTVQDFGPVPPEPEDEDSDAVKISMRLANGKSITRKYSKYDKTLVLFAVACEVDSENKTKRFDLISRFPPLNLSSALDKTIDECKIAGGNLLHRWL